VRVETTVIPSIAPCRNHAGLPGFDDWQPDQPGTQGATQMFRLFSALAVAGTLLVAGGVRADDDGAKAKKKKLDPEMLFKKLDTNDDGYLSLEEFKKFGDLNKKKKKDGDPKPSDK
jgi:hypothetical protein